MTDARFPERWLNDRRVMRLPADTFRFFVLSLAWSVSNRTDGLVPDDDLDTIPGASKERAAELQAAGLWSRIPAAFDLPPGWLIDVYAETQTSSQQLAALDRARRRDRERKAAERAAGRAVRSDVRSDVRADDTGQARPGQDSAGLTQSQDQTRSDKKTSQPARASDSGPVLRAVPGGLSGAEALRRLDERRGDDSG